MKYWLVNGDSYLVGGFNPSEKYESKWIISPSRDKNKKYLKPPPSYIVFKKNSLYNWIGFHPQPGALVFIAPPQSSRG